MRPAQPLHGIRPDELVRLTPKLKPYLRRSTPTWPDIVDAADWLRHDLGVSKSLWGDACLAMGRELAAVALAVVSTKDEEHFRTSPGGYFHGMVDKAKTGELHLERTVWALRRAAQPEVHPRTGRGGEGSAPDGGRAWWGCRHGHHFAATGRVFDLPRRPIARSLILCDFAQKVLFSSSRVEVNEIPEIKSFGAGDRVYVQAQQVWLVLVAYIMSSGRNPEKPCTIPYGKLAQKLGKDPRAGRNLTTALGIVGEYCKYNDLPTINSIVVNEKTGVPGDHVVLRDGKSPAEEQSDVMKRNWFTFRVPTTGTFRKVWEAVKDEWSQ